MQLSLGSAGLLIVPAQAFDLLQPFRSIVNQYIQIFEGYYNRTVNDVLGGVLGDILGGNTGELGIPDPPEAWQELEQVIGGDGSGGWAGSGVGRVAAAG
jgi:hypothetical protein